MDHQYKTEILTAALDARIGEEPDLQGFKAQIQGLLASSILEQRKAQIMLEVIREQVE
jgi:transcriptional regulator CtsR